MTTPFPGFPPESLKFLKALKRNNDREWFQPRKDEWERVLRAPMLELLARINLELMKFAPDYVTEPSKAIFRFYRDTRFSKDKSPYKTHMAAVFSHRAMPRNFGAGFYFQVSNEKVGIGGGIYQPPADLLRKIREHIAENHGEYRKTIRQVDARGIAGAFEGQPLTRVPKGWCSEHEAAELLKCRSLFFYAELPPETALTAGVEKEITSRFRVIAKFVQLLDQPIAGAKKFRLAEPF
jgi:uncharacterized protein (TIGR02453 family)